MHDDLVSVPAPPVGGSAGSEPPGGAGLAVRSPRPARRWGGWVAGALAAMGVIALVAAAFIRVPYVIISPGDATPLDQHVLDVKGAPTYRHRGDLLYLTVVVSNRDPNLYRYLLARLDGDSSVEKRQTVIGCAGYGETARLAVDQMVDSQDVAKAVALRKLGYDVPTDASQVQVVDVLCNGPSRRKLQLGDVVRAVDGTPVNAADDVRPLITAHRPGDDVTFTVERGDEQRDVHVRLGDRDGDAFAGIVTQTDTKHRIPVDVQIDTARVSGPSAGLAFSLAIIDRMSPGDLTGGRDVAVTGAINDDGSVGPVGGVAQKAVTAHRAGAKLMLVPTEEAKEARRHAGGMKVVGVHTIDDALVALANAGGVSIAAPAEGAQ